MVTQRLVSNFDTIFRAKAYFFLKKSIWKYLLFTLIMGYALPINELSPISSGLIYFVAVMILLWPLQYLSAKRFSKLINFDAIVEFNEQEIKLNHNNSNTVEVKDWNWVRVIEIKKERIWLALNEARPFAISIPKSKLSQSEIEFFKSKK
ncbi:hypothetical protein [Formosa sp. 4Alg 33]|uniref:hypothetical protein n=1 Tax=Formosa sp. 4Alg 33 TaxID=3382189 RepID=UPI003D9C67B9